MSNTINIKIITKIASKARATNTTSNLPLKLIY